MSTLNQSRNGPATVQLREAHPGPAHARAGVSEPARESPHRIGPRRPLVVVAVAVVVGLVAFAVWRLFLAPPAVAPGVIAVSGRIEGDDSAVAAKGSGRIREITVREGDRVEAGQVIAVLDDEQVRAREDQATAAVRQAEARARLAQHQIAVLEEQLRQSRLGVDQARADAEGRVNEAEGRLAAAEAQLTQAQATHAQAKWDREAMARLFQKGLVAEQEAQRARNNAPGTRVVLLNVWGSWRELIVSPAERVIPVSADLSDEDAAQALVNPVTAWVMTMVEHDLKPGDWLVQTAAGSTVGQLVLQLARSERFRTVNIVRRRAQAPDIKALGGEVVISSEDNDWGTQLATASTGKALSRAIDCVAGRIGATVARHLAPGGRMLVYGALSSHRQTDPSAFEMPVFAPRLIYSAAAVQGWYLLHWLEVTPLAECGAIFAKVLDRLASGALRLPPAKRHRPQNIADALRDADGAPREGKPLLDLSSWAAD